MRLVPLALQLRAASAALGTASLSAADCACARATSLSAAVLAIHVARFERVAQQAVDEKFITVDIQSFFLARFRGVQVALKILRDERCRERRWTGLPGRLAVAQQRLQKDDAAEQWRILNPAGKVELREQVTQIPLDGRRQRRIVRPLETGPVERDVTHVIRDQRETFRFEQRERFLHLTAT